MESGRGQVQRLAIALQVVALSACGATDCGGCLAPPLAPFPEASKVNDAVQARLSPSGITFLNANLAGIVESLAAAPCGSSDSPKEAVPCPEGTTCVNGEYCAEQGAPLSLVRLRVPKKVEQDPAWCMRKISLCEDPSDEECVVWLKLHNSSLVASPPAHLDVAVRNDAWSSWIPTVLERTDWWCPLPAPDCKIRFKRHTRDLTAGIDLRADNELDRLEVQIGTAHLPMDEDDIELDNAGGAADWVGCMIADLILPLFDGTIQDMINETIVGTAEDFLYESCDPNEVPRPECTSLTATTCGGEDDDWRCRFSSNGRPVPSFLGLEGELDLVTMLGSLAGDATGVSLSVGAGGYAQVVGEGVEVGFRGGTIAPPTACGTTAAAPSPPPPRHAFEDRVPPPEGGDPFGYMLGIAISDWLLDETVRNLHLGGALCQRLDAGLSDYINTGALGLLAPSLSRLTRGGAQPALVEMLPRSPLVVDIGLGSTIVDPSDPDRTLVDRPLITIRADEIDLDLYAMVEDRYVRFMTLRVELKIGLTLTDGGQGDLLLLVADPGDWLGAVEVLNTELLTDNPSDIEDAVPALVSAMFSQLAPALTQVFTLPSFAGFALTDLLIRGVQPRTSGGGDMLDPDGNPVLEFLGIFANLDFEPQEPGAALRFVAETEAWIERLHVPRPDGDVGEGVERFEEPQLWLGVALRGEEVRNVDEEVRAEYTYRVDGGFWRPFHRGHRLHVTDPALRLMGRHQVEVRARIVGAPSSLDPTPASVEVLVDPISPTLAVVVDEAAGVARIHAEDAITPSEALIVRHRFTTGRWATQRGSAPLPLPPPTSGPLWLEVEVEDEAGNRTRWSTDGAPPSAVLPEEVPAPPVATPGTIAPVSGCTSLAPGWPQIAGITASLGLLMWRRQRRSKDRADSPPH